MRINWLRTITAFDGPELQVEVMELDESGLPAADRPVRDARGRHRDPGARPGVRHRLPARGAGRRVRARRDRAGVARRSMTGCPGVFAGGDMVPSERTVTVGVGHGKKAARHIDAWLRGAAAASAPKHALATLRQAAPLVLRRRRPPRSSRSSRPRSASRTSARSSAASPPRRPSTRPAGACRAATASSATAASAPAPRTP